jgi:hypothetical protein
MTAAGSARFFKERVTVGFENARDEAEEDVRYGNNVDNCFDWVADCGR